MLYTRIRYPTHGQFDGGRGHLQWRVYLFSLIVGKVAVTVCICEMSNVRSVWWYIGVVAYNDRVYMRDVVMKLSSLRSTLVKQPILILLVALVLLFNLGEGQSSMFSCGHACSYQRYVSFLPLLFVL